MAKKVICYLNQYLDNISLDIYCLDVKKKNFLQELFQKNRNANYVVEEHFDYSFSFHKNTKLEEVAKYGEMIYQKLLTIEYETTPIDLILNIEGMFTGKITLPKLTGKSLNDSFELEYQKLYGDLTERFTCITNQTINESKGYDFDMLFIDTDHYQILTNIFLTQKIKIDHIYHTPSIFSSMFSKGNLINQVCIGVMIESEQTRIFLANRGTIEDYRIIKVGFNDIDKMISDKLEVSIADVKIYRHENRRKTNVKQVITKSMKTILDEIISVVAACEEIKVLDKIIINSTDGFTEDLLSPFTRPYKGIVDMYSANRDVQQNLLVDVFFGSNKHFVELPQKVKK